MSFKRSCSLNLITSQPEIVKLLALAGLVSASFVYYLNFPNSSVTWPANDNLAAVCRLLDANCLREDFFTNASSGTTPRLPYVYLLSEITRIANNGIGGGLAIIKSLLLILLPVVCSFVFIASIKTHTDNQGKNQWSMSPANIITITISPLFVYLLQGKVGLLLSVAWWPPLNFEAHAHNVSLLLTLIGFILLWFEKKYLGAAIVILGAIIHPVVGLFASIFSWIVLVKFNSSDKGAGMIGVGLGASLVGVTLARMLFAGDGSISAVDFVRVYSLEAHPAHYIPSQFGSLSSLKWIESFAIVAVGLLFITTLLYKLNLNIWKNAFLAFLVYSSSVCAQFLFVEVVQIKLVAAIGPSRFTMFGPWLLFIFLFVAIFNLIRVLRYEFLITLAANIIQRKLALIRWVHILSLYLLLAVSAVYYANNSNYFNLPDDAKAFFKFAEEETDINDVFVLPFFAPRVEFPLMTRRAIFSGNGFPFSERFFLEWENRNALAYGSNTEVMKLTGSWIGEKWANHYRQLSPIDFVEAARNYKIDWVVIEADHSYNFQSGGFKCEVGFESPNYKIFSIQALQQCIR